MWYPIKGPQTTSLTKAIALLLAVGAILQAIGSIPSLLDLRFILSFLSSIVFIVAAGVAVENVHPGCCCPGGKGPTTCLARVDQVGTLGFLVGTIMLLLGLVDYELIVFRDLGFNPLWASTMLWTLTGIIFLLTDITRVYNTDNVVTERELQQGQNRYPGNDADNLVVIAQPVHSSGVSTMIVEEV